MSPVFAHGQLRLYLLALLDEEPRHGYEVIQDLEQRFHGLYSPSAGTVYPRLAKLEQEGLVRRVEEGRRTTYSLTDAGHAQVRARAGDVRDLEADLDRSVREMAAQVRSQVKGSTADLRAELRAAAGEARRSAVPVTGGRADRRGGAGSSSEVDEALHTLRATARAIARSHKRDPELQARVLAILGEAQTQLERVR